jgi:general stress protein CsbA
LFHGGLLTTLLLVDDVYMWHEKMFPVYFGISTYFVYATYLIYAIYFLARFRKEILKTEYLILLASISLMSLSVLIDVMHDSQRFDDALLNITGFRPALLGEITVLLEETSKGLGILTWLIYFSRVLFINVLPAVKQAELKTSNRNPVSTFVV